MKFDEVYGDPWLYGGWTFASGDGDHNTFFQLLPSDRLYSMTPLESMSDPFATVLLEVSGHYLWFAEEEDRLYAGPGASKRRRLFGYTGVPGSGESDIGTLVDVQLSANITDYLGLALYYGHLFGDSVPGEAFEDSDIDYAFAKLNVRL